MQHITYRNKLNLQKNLSPMEKNLQQPFIEHKSSLQDLDV